MGILGSRKWRRYQRLCKDYSLIKPPTRPNQPYKYPRWAFRHSLGNRVCIRRFYGDLGHKGFRKVCRVKSSKNLVQVLESRLDINLYRLGFFSSIFFSRQAILHGKVLVNSKKITHSHFLLEPGDVVEFCPSFRPLIRSQLMVSRKERDYQNRLKVKPTPGWIHTDYSSLSFIMYERVNLAIFYPFRANLDEVIWFSKYGY
uniref:ribosomal protein S4 n=1 Tax=Microzonia abyssicola TaxID=217214 RepID=UPI002E79629A|nr:ribosomal protein S4 [Syringoderma abyssicola]WBP70361.1 ribosomal protein S4 [Syringoderma abyssicola]